MGLSAPAIAALVLARSAVAVHLDSDTSRCLMISLPVHQSSDHECGAFGTRAVSVRTSRADAAMLSAMDSLHWRHSEVDLESGERFFHWEVEASEFKLRDGDVHVFTLAASAALNTAALSLEVTKHCAAPPNLPVTTHAAVYTAAALTVSPAPATLCAPPTPSLSQRASSALRALLRSPSAARRLLDTGDIEEDGGAEVELDGIVETVGDVEADDDVVGLSLFEGSAAQEQTEPLLSAADAGIVVPAARRLLDTGDIEEDGGAEVELDGIVETVGDVEAVDDVVGLSLFEGSAAQEQTEPLLSAADAGIVV